MKIILFSILLLNIFLTEPFAQVPEHFISQEQVTGKQRILKGSRYFNRSGTPIIDSIKSVRLQFLLDSLHAADNYKGTAVCISIPGQNKWYGTTGVSHGSTPIHNRMHFGIGSQTKTFMAVLMLLLQERNVLDLDDSLSKWLPAYNNVNGGATIRQLLKHTSGIENFNQGNTYNDSLFSDMGRYWTNHEVISYFVGPPPFPPGQGWLYSNSNYVLACMVVKAATDTSEHVLIKKYILDPLGMNNTFYPPEDITQDTTANAWHFNADLTLLYPVATSVYSTIDGAGCMYSTNDDMVKFYEALYKDSLLSSSSLQEMKDYYTLGTDYGYGLGIFYEKYDWATLLHHGGDYWGYSSITIHDSSSHTTISILTNRYPTNYFNIGNSILTELFFGPVSGVTPVNTAMPTKYSLSQNFPNPFNPQTTINFAVPRSSYVQLKVYDVLGNEIAQIVDEDLVAGSYEVSFNASQLSSGIYFYRLKAGEIIETKKMNLIK